MSDAPQGADSLDQFIDNLAHDPNTPVPPGLDPELAAFVRALALTEQTADRPLAERTRVRLWEQAFAAAMRENLTLAPFQRGNHRASNPAPAGPLTARLDRQRKPARHLPGTAGPGILTALAATIVLVIFVSGLWVVMVGSPPTESGGTTTSGATPPVQHVTVTPTPGTGPSPTILVNSMEDAAAGCPQSCTLRAAIAQAKDGDIIGFAASATGTIRLHSSLVIRHNISILGPDTAMLQIDGGSADIRLVDIDEAVVTLSGLILQHAQTLLPGGAIRNGRNAQLFISDSRVLDNASGAGGGIYNQGQLVVSNVTFSENSSATSGGGIFSEGGTVRVTGSTFSENSAANRGGGIAIDQNASAEIVNSTFSANSAVGDGGAIANDNGQLAITSSTIYSNTAVAQGGGITSEKALILKSTIVAGNTAMKGGADIRGDVTSQGFNLIGDPTQGSGFGPSDQLGVDPHLEGLNLNAPGRTPTLALEAGSPAIGMGGRDCPAVDQRGVRRKNPCDVGAYET